jgi:hypothetical protein
MAIIDTEGFGASSNINDFVNYGLIATTVGDVAISTNGPLGDNYAVVGGYSLSSSRLNLRPLGANYTTFFCGVRVLVNPNIGGNEHAIAFTDFSGATQLTLVFNGTNGTITVYRGATTVNGGSGTLLGTGSTTVPLNAWFYIEIGATIDPSAGAVTVRLNGVNVSGLVLSSINTQGDGGSTTVNGVQFIIGSTSLTSSFAHYYFADATGSSPWNTFLGDVRIQTLLPTGAGAITDFTPHGDSFNWQNAATVPPSPTVQFNSNSTSGDSDLFTMTSVATNETTIYGVQVKSLLAKTDAGARTVAAVLKSSSTTTTGSAVAASATSQYVRAMFQADPNTSAQWTQSNVDAAQAGYTIVS